MLPNAFIGRTVPPTENDLRTELGEAKVVWDQLVSDLVSERTIDVQEWNSFSPKRGWALRLKRGKRAILYMLPQHGAFSVAMVLGGKAVQAAHDSKLPARFVKIIDEGKQYPEGRDVRVDVRSATDIPAIRKLAAIKLEN
jgi:Protein of unknown function (DUF3788)